jgi:hypothetical protein
MGVADWLKPAESNQERSGWPKLVTAWFCKQFVMREKWMPV